MSRQLRVGRRELTYQVYKSSGFNLFTTVKIEVQHLRRFPVHGA